MKNISELQRFKNNIKAIKLILDIKASETNYSELSKLYSGAGNFPYFSFRVMDIKSGVFENKSNKPYLEEIKNLITSLENEGYTQDKIQTIFSKIARSTLYAYYTDKEIVDAIAEKIVSQNQDLINDLTAEGQTFKILDPSAGTGVFAKSFADTIQRKQEQNLISKDALIQIDSIEPEPISFAILQSLKNDYSQKNIKFNSFQGKFENFSVTESRKYDIIVSNIPFGKLKIQDSLIVKELDIDDNPLIHSYFFLKSTLLLNDSGQIGFLTTSNFMDSPKLEKDRAALFSQCDLQNFIRLPKETFKGTEVQTDFILLKKNKNIDIEKQATKIKSEKFTADFLNITDENNPNKDKTQSYNLNLYVLRNKNFILGEWQTNFMHGSYTLSSTINNAMSKEQIPTLFARRLEKQNLYTTERLVQEPRIKISQENYPKVKDLQEYNLNLNSEIKEKIEKQKQEFIHPITPIQLSLFDFDSFDTIEIASDLKDINNDKDIYEKLQIKSVNQKIEKAKEEQQQIQLLKSELSEAGISHYSGAYIIYQNQPYILEKTEKDYYIAQNIKLTIQGKELVLVKNKYSLLQEAIRSKAAIEDVKKAQEELKTAYELYAMKFGNITKDIAAINTDYYATELLGIEYKNSNGDYVPSDIITKIDFFHAQKIIETPEQAFIACLQNFNGNVNLNYIAELLGKETKEEKITLATELIKKQLIYNDYDFDVDKNKVNYKFSTEEEFLSGNIPLKIKILTEIIEREKTFDYITKEQLINDLDKLHLNDVSVKNFEDLVINVNAEFIEKKYLEKFLKNKFEFNGNDFFTFSKEKGFVITQKSFQNSYQLNQFSVSGKNKSIGGYSVLSDIINDKSFQYTYKVKSGDKEIIYKDIKAIKEAQLKGKQLKSEWKSYLFSLSPEEQTKILEDYNKVFCSNVPKKFNGNYLDFSDIKGINNIHEHQSNGTSMILQNDGGIIDHKVGAGKSIVMFASAIKLKESGLKKKPLITCLLPTAEQIYKEFKFHYPNAKILLANPEPSSKLSPEEQRQAMYSRIANNDWDCIIMSHDELTKIPVPLDIQIDYVEERLEELRDNLYFSSLLSEDGIKKQDLKRLEAKIESEEQKLENLFAKQNKQKTKSSYDFSSLDIDHIFVDESHIFKKMPFTTIHHGVAGLDMNPSERAMHLSMIVRSLRKNHNLVDKGLTILSGTHISNSMAEIFHLFNLIIPQKLKEMGINTFDRFAKTFFQKESQSEISIGGKIKEKERFRYIVNVPELKSLYMSIAHVVNDSNFKVPTPNVKNIYEIIEPNFQQEKFNDILVGFIEGDNDAINEFEKITNKNYNDDQQQAASLIVSNFSLKNGIDPRLINEEYFTEPSDGKVNRCCKNVFKHYEQTKKDKGVQLVFCDIGINNANGEFTVYKELKKILIEKYNIPSDEIQFANDWKAKAGSKKDQSLRAEFSKKTNEGDFRIIIGSTATLGTGRNVQKRIIGMHDLDIPWKPSDNEQRTGRGKRQGNEIAEKYENTIFKYTYLSKKSLDVFRSQANEMKDKFLSIFKKVGIDTPRIMDEGEIDGDGGSTNFSLMKAYILDNPEMMEISKLEKRMEGILQNKESILIQHGKTKRNLTYYENEFNEDINLKQKYCFIYNEAQKTFNVDDIKLLENNYPFEQTLIYDINLKNYREVPKDIKKIGEYLRLRYEHIMDDINNDTNKFKLDSNFKFKVIDGKIKYTSPLLKQGNFEAEIEILIDNQNRVKDFSIKIESKIPDNELIFIRRSSIIPKDEIEAANLISREILNRTSPDSLFYLQKRIESNQNKINFLSSQLGTYDLSLLDKYDVELESIKARLVELKDNIEKKSKEKEKKKMPKL